MDPFKLKPKCLWIHGPIIVGAGPSGIAVAACLSEQGVPSLILERSDCIASLWKNRTYDRLKLHLPKHFCELPLMSFPLDFPKYPTKHQFISYMESYADQFGIRPSFNQTVISAEFDPCSQIWNVKTLDGFDYSSPWLVVATGENAEPVIPKIHGMEHFHGPILHTSDYKSGSRYKNKKVLVIGCGNSGMEVTLDLCRHNALPHLVARNKEKGAEEVKEMVKPYPYSVLYQVVLILFLFFFPSPRVGLTLVPRIEDIEKDYSFGFVSQVSNFFMFHVHLVILIIN